MHLILAVYKGAGEQNMPAEIWRLLGAVAGFSHLVLHYVYFLHRRVARVIGGWSTDHKIWEVSANRKGCSTFIKLFIFCFLLFSLMMASGFDRRLRLPPPQETMPFVKQFCGYNWSCADGSEQNSNVLWDDHGGTISLRHQFRWSCCMRKSIPALFFLFSFVIDVLSITLGFQFNPTDNRFLFILVLIIYF